MTYGSTESDRIVNADLQQTKIQRSRLVGGIVEADEVSDRCLAITNAGDETDDLIIVFRHGASEVLAQRPSQRRKITGRNSHRSNGCVALHVQV